jgi:hypothetical protein
VRQYYEQQAPAPVSGLEDLLVSILERGLVLVIRLQGEPGDRRLMVGVGLPESVDPVLLALGATGVFRRPDTDAEWWQ